MGHSVYMLQPICSVFMYFVQNWSLFISFVFVCVMRDLRLPLRNSLKTAPFWVITRRVVVTSYEITISDCVITQKSAVLNLCVCFIICPSVSNFSMCMKTVWESLQAISAYAQHRTHQHTDVLHFS